jgi:hypothetical protein
LVIGQEEGLWRRFIVVFLGKESEPCHVALLEVEHKNVLEEQEVAIASFCALHVESSAGSVVDVHLNGEGVVVVTLFEGVVELNRKKLVVLVEFNKLLHSRRYCANVAGNKIDADNILKGLRIVQRWVGDPSTVNKVVLVESSVLVIKAEIAFEVVLVGENNICRIESIGLLNKSLAQNHFANATGETKVVAAGADADLPVAARVLHEWEVVSLVNSDYLVVVVGKQVGWPRFLNWKHQVNPLARMNQGRLYFELVAVGGVANQRPANWDVAPCRVFKREQVVNLNGVYGQVGDFEPHWDGKVERGVYFSGAEDGQLESFKMCHFEVWNQFVCFDTIELRAGFWIGGHFSKGLRLIGLHALPLNYC